MTERFSEFRVGWQGYLAVLLFYFSLMFVGLGEARGLTKHEVFAAQPAREMLAGGRWAIQEFGGEPRYQKPPAMSWMIALSFNVFGEREWAARLPAVLAGGAMVGMVMWWGARNFGREVGLISGLMQGTFFYVVMQARLGEVDMPLGAVVCGGMLCLGAAWVGECTPRKRAVLGWVFAGLAGVTVALKGPVGLGVMYLGVVAFAGLMRSWGVLWWGFHPGRLVVMLLVGGAWPLWAWVEEPRIFEFWEKEIRGRVGTGIQGAEPWWFYFWNVPMMLLPWAVFAVPAAVAVRRAWETASVGQQRALLRFTLAWVGGGFLLLSVAADKHKHYCIPILAGVTPWLAWGMWLYLKRLHAQAPRFYGVVMGVWAIAFLGAAVGIVLRVQEHGLVLACAVGVVGVGGLAVLEMERRRWFWPEVGAVFATAWGVLAVVNGGVTPAFDDYTAEMAFGRRVSAVVPTGEKIWVTDVGMGQVSFYLRLPVGRVDQVGEALPAGKEIRWVVLPGSSIEKLKEKWGVELQVLDEVRSGEGIKGRKRAEDWLVLGRVGG